MRREPRQPSVATLVDAYVERMQQLRPQAEQPFEQLLEENAMLWGLLSDKRGKSPRVRSPSPQRPASPGEYERGEYENVLGGLHPIARNRNQQARKLEAKARRVAAGALDDIDNVFEGRSVSISTVGRIAGAAHRLAEKARRRSKEEVVYRGPAAFEQSVIETTQLTSGILTRHQRFIPGRPDAGLFDKGNGGEVQGRRHVGMDGELRRRLKEYKYHRHIEPALPPIVTPAQFQRSGSAPNLSAESEEATRRREIVERNVSAGSLTLHSCLS